MTFISIIETRLDDNNTSINNGDSNNHLVVIG